MVYSYALVLIYITVHACALHTLQLRQSYGHYKCS